MKLHICETCGKVVGIDDMFRHMNDLRTRDECGRFYPKWGGSIKRAPIVEHLKRFSWETCGRVYARDLLDLSNEKEHKSVAAVRMQARVERRVRSLKYSS